MNAEEITKQSKVFLMMKGTPDFPECGFSKRVVAVLGKHKVEFTHFNVFDNPSLMDEIKANANWPTTPQLWINGKFIGGCDIVESLDASGELEKLLS